MHPGSHGPLRTRPGRVPAARPGRRRTRPDRRRGPAPAGDGRCARVRDPGRWVRLPVVGSAPSGGLGPGGGLGPDGALGRARAGRLGGLRGEGPAGGAGADRSAGARALVVPVLAGARTVPGRRGCGVRGCGVPSGAVRRRAAGAGGRGTARCPRGLRGGWAAVAARCGTAGAWDRAVPPGLRGVGPRGAPGGCVAAGPPWPQGAGPRGAVAARRWAAGAAGCRPAGGRGAGTRGAAAAEGGGCAAPWLRGAGARGAVGRGGRWYLCPPEPQVTRSGALRPTPTGRNDAAVLRP